MEKCAFCRIEKGQLPTWKVYETDLVMVLLAKEMEVFWHTLVLPKKHYKDITDIPKNTLSEMMEVTKKIILHYQKTFWSTGANLIAATGEWAQQSTPHFHFHLMPRFFKDDGLDMWPVLPKIQVDKDELLKRVKIVE